MAHAGFGLGWLSLHTLPAVLARLSHKGNSRRALRCVALCCVRCLVLCSELGGPGPPRQDSPRLLHWQSIPAPAATYCLDMPRSSLLLAIPLFLHAFSHSLCFFLSHRPLYRYLPLPSPLFFPLLPQASLPLLRPSAHQSQV